MPRVPSRADERASDTGPGDFGRLVRDALRHLHDPVYLQTHPLAPLSTEPNDTPLAVGKRLHRLLVEAIASLRPEPSVGDARARRRHDLLSLRYVEALEIDEVAARLAISRREYSREHRQALDAVVALLAERSADFLFPPPLLAAPVQTAGEAPAPGRVPRPLTSFVGREWEIAEVLRLVTSTRLVTLSGPPGTGKTRLALQVAGEATTASGPGDATFPNGVAFVPLASVLDPGLVASAIAQTLGVRQVPNRPPLESLEVHLSRSRMLLILDNFEHVLEATPAVSRLLAACPNLAVLVTSRASLRLSGEHEFVVPPLGVPERGGSVSLERVGRTEAVRLYVDRARAAHAAFRLTEQNAPAVIELCHRLDGLPLAIELAAARGRTFPPYALLGRLGGAGDGNNLGAALLLLTGGPRDAPDRQRTLRSAIDWSYRLLTAGEQRLFARLSVFAGGWGLDAAEAVCAFEGDLDVLEGVASLVDKSLVQPSELPGGEPRFVVLETIREYARERLEALDKEARTTWRRHAEHFLAVAREADANFWGPERARWLARLNLELDNLRAALRWSTTHDVETALQLGGALFWFWHDGGHWSEARVWLERALALASPGHRTEGRAAALSAAGVCNWCLGNFATAQVQSEECLAIYRDLGDRRGTGHAFHGLGMLAAARGDLASARELIEEGLALARTVDDRPFVGLALHNLGLFAMQENDEATARSYIEASRRVWHELGSAEALSLAANCLGDLARSRGDYAEAAAYYRECLDLIGEAGPPRWRADYLCNLAHAAHHVGDGRAARALFAEALALCRELNDRAGAAECVAGLACLVAETQPQRSARLVSAAEAAVEAMESHLSPSSQADREQALATARSRLGDDAFGAAWRQGRSLVLEQAVAEALAEPAPP